MESNKHVDIESLREYITGGDRNEFQKKIRHFEGCKYCREQFKKSSIFREVLAMLNGGRNN